MLKTPMAGDKSKIKKRLLMVGALVFAALVVFGFSYVTPHHQPSPSFVGSEACASCHQKAYTAWQGSQHAHAMAHANSETVLGNFNQVKFKQGAIESIFFRRDGKYFVTTDGPDGELADFEIKYTFGIYPLQQYLVEFADGRVQALSIAWDSRAARLGGQRWFHLYPRETIDFTDELHWTKRSQNWNYMCADCHSTDVRKHYDPVADKFKTTWQEIAVGCESCHGPGSNHLIWSQNKSKSDSAMGLTNILHERRDVHWHLDPATGNSRRDVPRTRSAEVDTCAQCHSRRTQISEGYHAGKAFQDFYRPETLAPDLYFADGQQREEVYTWGSFLQSRMNHAGVTCSDCHEPHSQKTRAQGNDVCATCHSAAKYNSQNHHHHTQDSTGAQCVNCHMPTTTYMVIDARHDHSIRIPRPDLSAKIGTPNACNGCHTKSDATWAAKQVGTWYGHPAFDFASRSFQTAGDAFTAADGGLPQADQWLERVVADISNPAITRATAFDRMTTSLLAGQKVEPSAGVTQRAISGLKDPDPQVRRASVAMLQSLPEKERLNMIGPLLSDPIRVVRIEAASVLADAMDGATGQQKALFKAAGAEFEATQNYNADRPESLMLLGNYDVRRGESADAEATFKRAIHLDPSYAPAYVNLADLMRVNGRDSDGELLLRNGVRVTPRTAGLHHALGLTLIRLQKLGEATTELKVASELDPENARYAYVYSSSLQSAGRLREAIVELNRILKVHPSDRDLLIAAVTICRDTGEIAAAKKFAKALRAVDPSSSEVSQLAHDLGLR